MNQREIENVKSIRYLGITKDNNLSFSFPFLFSGRKINTFCGSFQQLSKLLRKNTRKQIVCATYHSI